MPEKGSGWQGVKTLPALRGIPAVSSLPSWDGLCHLASAMLRLAAESLAFWRWRKTMTTPVYLTTHTAAKRCGCEQWQIRRLYELGILPEPPRLGQRRIIHEADLPAIREALAKWRDGRRKGERAAS
jgi:hypothetical protein